MFRLKLKQNRFDENRLEKHCLFHVMQPIFAGVVLFVRLDLSPLFLSQPLLQTGFNKRVNMPI